MVYEIKSPDNKRVVRYWEDERCHPVRGALESMLDCGYKLYIDGVKQTKAQALKLVKLEWTKVQLDNLPDVIYDETNTGKGVNDGN